MFRCSYLEHFLALPISLLIEGYDGDTSTTFYCGDVDDEAKKLVQLWVGPGSKAAEEKEFFYSHLAPFYRIEQYFQMDPDNYDNYGGVEHAEHCFQHAGVPFIDMYYGRDFPVYHTAFDSYNWMAEN